MKEIEIDKVRGKKKDTWSERSRRKSKEEGLVLRIALDFLRLILWGIK